MFFSCCLVHENRILKKPYRNKIDPNSKNVKAFPATILIILFFLDFILIDLLLEEMKIQFGLARDAHRDVLFDNFDDVPSFPELGQL